MDQNGVKHTREPKKGLTGEKEGGKRKEQGKQPNAVT